MKTEKDLHYIQQEFEPPLLGKQVKLRQPNCPLMQTGKRGAVGIAKEYLLHIVSAPS